MKKNPPEECLKQKQFGVVSQTELRWNPRFQVELVAKIGF